MATGAEDLMQAADAASVIGLLPSRPRVLALGEPTHGEDILLEARNAIFQRLVEEEGYRTIALESDCLLGLIVDDYVTKGIGELEEVVERAISHGFGASVANRELVRWMRAYNKGRPEQEWVRFAGMDGPLEITAAESPGTALRALLGYLADHLDRGLLPCTAQTLDELLREDAQWTNPEAMMDPSASAGRSAQAVQLRLLADELLALLEAHTPKLIAASRQQWDRARLHGRTALGLLRYHYWMADASPARMARLLDLRASMMAANLLACAERGPVLAYAHNAHLQRPMSSMGMWQGPVEWWSAGAILNARLGPGYAYLAMGLGTIRHQGVDTPPPETLEGLLYALPEECFLVDSRRLAAFLGDTTATPRTSPWFGYAPLHPAHLKDIDGLVFIKDCPQR